jgi:hypothetical protein
MKHLVTYQPMSGMIDSPHSIYLATSATQTGPPSDAEEAGLISWIPLSDIQGMVTRGELLGSGTLVGLLHVLAYPR